jgi:hypothetical protein
MEEIKEIVSSNLENSIDLGASQQVLGPLIN